jgi:hypothetical protein
MNARGESTRAPGRAGERRRDLAGAAHHPAEVPATVLATRDVPPPGLGRTPEVPTTRAPLWVLLADLVAALQPEAEAGDVVRVGEVELDMPLDLRIALGSEGVEIRATPPLWRLRTAFDPPPARLRVSLRPEPTSEPGRPESEGSP